SDTKPKPLVEPARRIDFHHCEGNCSLGTRGLPDQCLHDLAADPLPLAASAQIKLFEKDDIVRRFGLEPANIHTSHRDDPDLSQQPLKREVLAMPRRIKIKCLDDPAHALEVEAPAENEIFRFGWAECEAARHALDLPRLSCFIKTGRRSMVPCLSCTIDW